MGRRRRPAGLPAGPRTPSASPLPGPGLAWPGLASLPSSGLASPAPGGRAALPAPAPPRLSGAARLGPRPPRAFVLGAPSLRWAPRPGAFPAQPRHPLPQCRRCPHTPATLLSAEQRGAGASAPLCRCTARAMPCACTRTEPVGPGAALARPARPPSPGLVCRVPCCRPEGLPLLTRGHSVLVSSQKSSLSTHICIIAHLLWEITPHLALCSHQRILLLNTVFTRLRVLLSAPSLLLCVCCI